MQQEDLAKSDTNELVVTPGTFYPEDVPCPFGIFRELQEHAVAVPRYWAQRRFGPAKVFMGTTP